MTLFDQAGQQLTLMCHYCRLIAKLSAQHDF
uniref:Uncharacterized protein n=1 Tax=Anguilla anguilla TaxID=7936 RepID=A0A0E9U2K1_ANGAN